MIIPMNDGRTTTPIYIPPVVTTNPGVLQQSSTNTQNNEPTLVSWIVLGAFLILLIAVVVYLFILLKDLSGGKK